MAISNHRLAAIDDRSVTFHWKDYADGNTRKLMTLGGVEFLRRFLQHVMPSGFVRIRHFGLLANRFRDEKLTRCRTMLAERPTGCDPDALAGEEREGLNEESGIGDSAEPTPAAIRSCPVCGKGRMVVTEVLPRSNAIPHSAPMVVGDTS